MDEPEETKEDEVQAFAPSWVIVLALLFGLIVPGLFVALLLTNSITLTTEVHRSAFIWGISIYVGLSFFLFWPSRKPVSVDITGVTDAKLYGPVGIVVVLVIAMSHYFAHVRNGYVFFITVEGGQRVPSTVIVDTSETNTSRQVSVVSSSSGNGRLLERVYVEFRPEQSMCEFVLTTQIDQRRWRATAKRPIGDEGTIKLDPISKVQDN